MRLFCGLALSYQVRRNIELLLEHLRPQASIGWSPAANLHVTTKFIGEWPDEDLPRLIEKLREVPQPREMELAVRGLGWFPNPHQPRVFFAGVSAPPALATLHGDVDRTLSTIGVRPETKPYNPHLTLARIKDKADLSALRRAVAELPSAEFGKFTASKHLLFRSQLKPTGSVYSVISEFPLT
jgi:2'-5' RNA ligase